MNTILKEYIVNILLLITIIVIGYLVIKKYFGNLLTAAEPIIKKTGEVIQEYKTDVSTITSETPIGFFSNIFMSLKPRISPEEYRSNIAEIKASLKK